MKRRIRFEIRPKLDEYGFAKKWPKFAKSVLCHAVLSALYLINYLSSGSEIITGTSIYLADVQRRARFEI